MTLRSKAHFELVGNTWLERGDTYQYGKLRQAWYDAIPEGTVGVQYVVKLTVNSPKVNMLDAPNPPFQTGEGGE